jgi:superfamily II DNA or RNA helicase
VFPALAATGRLVWFQGGIEDWDHARPITWDDGEPWCFRLRAELDGQQRRWRMRGELFRDDQIRQLADATKCFHSGLLLSDDTLLRFNPPKDVRWIETFLENEALDVPTKDRDAFVSELWRSGEPPEVAGDPSLCLPTEAGKPTGRIVIHPPGKQRPFQPGRYLYASQSYLYGGREVAPHTPHAAWLAEDGKAMVSRDADAEAKLYARLLELGFEPKTAMYYGDTSPGHLQFSARELGNVVEKLVAEAWVVEAEGSRIRKANGISLSVRSGVDWFDLEGSAEFDGVTVLLPDLLAALRGGEQYVRLDDGTRGLLPKQWLEQYAPLADLATKSDGSTLRFQPGQALLLDSLLAGRANEHALQVDQRFAALRTRLRSFSGVKPQAPPREFRGTLREYQREGLGWLRFLEKFGFGGCLADDMGLGKTIQALAILSHRARRQPKQDDHRPSLIVAPKSVVHNWRLEAERFSPSLTVADYTGLDRKDRVPRFEDHHLVLTTYGTLRQDIERFGRTRWDYVILDEAQAIKNAASQSAKASRLLEARHRLALSGTPVENHLGELWSIFEFLNPGFLGRSQAFGKLARNRLVAGDARLEALRKGLAPFLLRRTKKQVLPQLPEKTEQILYCDLPPAQRKQYNQLRDHYRTSLAERISQAGLAKSKIQVLEALLRLRQAACHPGLIDGRQKEKPSAKLDVLLEQLEEIVQEGHKALVFSQFTKMLDIVRGRLDAAGIVYEYLDGKTSNRRARIDRFQADAACPVFLISLKAGGSGLNLTAADFVFLLDPWWNPAVEAQAIDRTHRIGQTKPVFAYRLIARETVEEKILELQSRKRNLAESVISADDSLLKSLSADDLRSLLS